jgi:hypothetical protein
VSCGATPPIEKQPYKISLFYMDFGKLQMVESVAHPGVSGALSGAPGPSGGAGDARARPLRRLIYGMLTLLVALAASAGLVAQARASGNASAAAGFVESAQNKDGGFGEKRGKSSSPEASLWAAMALLAAGKNPGDEWVKGGASLDEYLAAHASAYTSLSDLGLLAMVQSAAQGSSSYGDPAGKLEKVLTPAAARQNPEGGALGIFGLIAVGTPAAKQTATAAAQALLASPTSDGGWGNEGLSDSASTALVLQALAASGVASSSTPAVQAGVAYLHKAQGNDGSIAPSIRTDQAIASGSVTATAFTIQALNALGLPALETPTGKSVLEGLTQYQQQTTGGLTSDGSLYSEIPPSVTETAQAFPAFDGIVFPLASVPRATSGPPSKNKSSAKSQHVSSGSVSQGVSDASGTGSDQGAYKQATATGSAAPASKAKVNAGSKSPGPKKTKASAKQQGAAASPGGTSVSGEVVGGAKPAKLVSLAGQSAGGLSAAEKATLYLAGLLVACALLGGFLDTRRPREDGRSLAAVSVAASASFLAAARARGALVPFAVALIGVALIVFPFTTRMFDRAPKGATMIGAFKPYMQPARLASYDLDVRELNEGVTQGAAKGPALLSPHASAAVALKQFDASDPELVQFNQQWPQVRATLTGLLDTIQANRSNYDAVAALPSFKLFPWFFVVPGALLILLAAVALAVPSVWGGLRWAIVALAIGLILAPLAFGMWSRAPRGATMVSAFRTVETRSLVIKIQNDFGTITTGEGALSGELVPALEEHGLSTLQIDKALPAVAKLESRWIGILQNLTPMIGVMSNNVTNYQAVAALPAFGLFPWLFLIPGLLVLALVVLSRTGPRMPIRRGVPVGESGSQSDGAPIIPPVEPMPAPEVQLHEHQLLTHSKEHDVLSRT